MAASKMKFSKVLNSLPSTLTPNTVYLVKPAGATSITMHVSNAAGTAAHPVRGTGAEIEPFLLLGVQSG